jgi:hypothetical protein
LAFSVGSLKTIRRASLSAFVQSSVKSNSTTLTSFVPSKINFDSTSFVRPNAGQNWNVTQVNETGSPLTKLLKKISNFFFGM